jgi:hypothetical protein
MTMTERYEIGIFVTTDECPSFLLNEAIEFEDAVEQECSAENLDDGRCLVKIIVDTDRDQSELLDDALESNNFGEVDEEDTYVLYLPGE